MFENLRIDGLLVFISEENRELKFIIFPFGDYLKLSSMFLFYISI